MSFYFDFHTYFKVIRLVITDRPSPKRLLIHFMVLVLLSGWALYHAICMELDKVFFPRYRKTQIKNPVFIVGNARSGTTLFQRLLSEDEDNFIYFKGWEVLFPALIQKKILTAFTTALQMVFPNLEERYVKFEEGRTKEINQMRPVGLMKQEEDEFLMIISFASPAIVVLFPYLDELNHMTAFDERVPPQKRQKVMRFYRECVLRQLYYHGGTRTLVSKNPSFTMKMRSLGEEFPDAKFVYMMRNPFETIPSLLDLMRVLWEKLGMDMKSKHIEQALNVLADDLVHDYKFAMEVLAEWPEDRYAIVEYNELTADVKATVEKVYDKLNLSISPAFEQKLNAELNRQKQYHSSHAYSLQEFGLSESKVYEELSDIIERFNYRHEDVATETTKEML
jgi:hypothetical protein